MSQHTPPSRRRFLQAGSAALGSAALPRWARRARRAGADRLRCRAARRRCRACSSATRPTARCWSGAAATAPRACSSSGAWTSSSRRPRASSAPTRCETPTSPRGRTSPACPTTARCSCACRFQSLDNDARAVRAGARPLRHAARRPRRRRRRLAPRPPRQRRDDLRFVWGGDTAGQGWGINPAFGGMKIYEAMRQRQPRLLHPQRRHHLRRRPDPRSRSPPRTGSLWTQHRHARGEQGRRDAGRVPRPLPLQPARRERAPLQRRSAADLAVGRPRGHQQLVRRARTCRPTRATPRRTCRCWRRAARAPSSTTRRCARSTRASRSASTASFSLRPAARRVRDRHAQLPRPEHRQPAAGARRRHGLPRPRAARVAQARPGRARARCGR